MQVKKGSTDVTVYFHLRNDSDGKSKTGLVYNSAGAVASYTRNRGTRTAITLATLAAADSAHSDGGFKEVDGTNEKGLYRLDIPDATIATGVDRVIIHIGFTDVFEESVLIELVDNTNKDIYDDVTLVKGLLGANCVLDDFTYDSNSKAVTGNAYIYDTPANANTHDKSTGLLLKIDGVAVIGADGNTSKLTRTVA